MITSSYDIEIYIYIVQVTECDRPAPEIQLNAMCGMSIFITNSLILFFNYTYAFMLYI